MCRSNYHRKARRRVYLAAPLFSDAERTFNALVALGLEEWVDVYLPQRDGGLMSEMVEEGIESDVAACRVFKRDMDAILQADYLIAILDGRAIDEDRLAQEIALIADKLDITEEIVRLKTHLGACRQALASEAAVGRQLGFLGQEMLREINTIGSKANDAEIAHVVIAMKGEMEKIREQSENVE